MADSNANRINPYPGPQYFKNEYYDFFFGREQEAQMLVSVVIANRIVLLYAQSGAGKTSIMQARVIPALREQGIDVLPVARVSGEQTLSDDIPNVYAANVLRDWPPVEGDSQMLSEYLDAQRKQIADGEAPVLRVAIFDQFEEFFTFYPERWQHRADFFRDVQAALDADRSLRVVFVMREEYVARFAPYEKLFEERTPMRFHLERMRADKARLAIIEPAKRLDVDITHEAADHLLNQLLKIEYRDINDELTTVTGEFVELVQLQVACRQMWQRVVLDSPYTVSSIMKSDVEAFGSVSDALANFYNDCIRQVGGIKDTTSGELRTWFEKKLLTPDRTRNLVFHGKDDTAGLDNEVVAALDKLYIIRKVNRANSEWYELAHDRFIDAVLTANQEHRERERQALESMQLEIKQSRQQFFTRLVTVVLAIVMLGLVGVAGFFGYAVSQYNQIVEPYRAEIANLGFDPAPSQPMRILAADGTVIAEFLSAQSQQSRVGIEDDKVSPWFLHALISSEDPDFYERSDTSWTTIFGIVWDNLIPGQGSSDSQTIPRQMAASLLLDSPSVSGDRQLYEQLLAFEIESTYGKDEILNIYINDAYFGQQTYGVGAAAEFYFDKSAAELNPVESALLVGMLPQPASTNPIIAPQIAFSNMRFVLEEMEEECVGFEHALPEGYTNPLCGPDLTSTEIMIQIAQVETAVYLPRQTDFAYPHFVDYVLAELELVYGINVAIERGVVVQTTLLPRVADAAEEALRQQVDNLSVLGVDTGAVVAVDPNTGAIRALIGSPDFEAGGGQINHAQTFHQTGNAILPVLYATALEGHDDDYLTPASIIWDVPTTYTLGSDREYSPVNSDRQYRGPVPLRFALQQHLNVPAAKLLVRFGTDDFIEMADRLGVSFMNTDLELASVIGGTSVRLIDLTSVYATIANDGLMTDVYAIESITEVTDGQPYITTLARPKAQQEISPQVAFLLQSILSDNIARTSSLYGIASPFPPDNLLSGRSLGLPDQGVVMAATGTTERDLWTLGSVDQLAVGVWLGSQDNAPLRNLTGLTAAAPVWNAVMRSGVAGRTPTTFQAPPGIVQSPVCQLTGALDSSDGNCPLLTSAVYIESQPPPSAAEVFVQTIEIDSWTGRVANAFCPDNRIQRTFVAIDDPFAVNWLNTTASGQSILEILGLPKPLNSPPTEACQSGQQVPVSRINIPEVNSVLSDLVSITGQVSAPDLDRWELSVSRLEADTFMSLSAPSSEQLTAPGSLLARWNTYNFANGSYVLRLALYSRYGGFIYHDVPMTVSNMLPTSTPVSDATSESTPAPLPFNTGTPDDE